MDQRIFDQLDVLERGARSEGPSRHAAYDHRGTGYPTHDDYNTGHRSTAAYHTEYQESPDEFIDQPMTLDAFGRHSHPLHLSCDVD